MDRRADGPTDRRTNGWTDRPTRQGGVACPLLKCWKWWLFERVFGLIWQPRWSFLVDSIFFYFTKINQCFDRKTYFFLSFEIAWNESFLGQLWANLRPILQFWASLGSFQVPLWLWRSWWTMHPHMEKFLFLLLLFQWYLYHSGFGGD